MIETERLILRPYRDADREAFAVLNGDPQVGYWVAGALDRGQSDALMDRISLHMVEHGFGLWGVTAKGDERIIGFCGLQHVGPGLPVAPAVEIGWRLVPEAWGAGYATEAAAAALDWAFANLVGLSEIIAFTAQTNLKSQAVMNRIGMTRDQSRDFLHPRLADDHPLRPHVVFAARRS